MWRSPTGIFTENLVGPELLASSAGAGAAASSPAAATALALPSLRRGRREEACATRGGARREMGSHAWSGGAGFGGAKARCGGAGRRRWRSVAGLASIAREAVGGELEGGASWSLQRKERNGGRAGERRREGGRREGGDEIGRAHV